MKFIGNLFLLVLFIVVFCASIYLMPLKFLIGAVLLLLILNS